MSDDALDDLDHDDDTKGKKGLIFAALLVLLLGIGAGLHFSGMLDSFLKSEEAYTAQAPGTGEAAKVTDSSTIVYYDLPHIMANLNPGSATPSFIKTTVTVEAPSQEVVNRLQAIQPKVMDIINTYIRELRPSDLKGSAGIYRLRDELMLRVNKALYPDKVNNILFKEILIQ